MMDLRAALSNPGVYDLWSHLVGVERCRAFLVHEHVRPIVGGGVLDVGCGTGSIMNFMPPDVRYVGVDISASYIARARRHYGERAEFCVGDASALEHRERVFDVVVACGVLHHLDDTQARTLFLDAAGMLTREGRMVTIDPVIADGQSRISRAVMARDRGRYIRTSEAYADLPGKAFASASVSIYRGLLRIPYWHCVLDLGA